MILELKSRQGAYLACQAIAQVQIRNRAIGRSVLEGLVREQLELHLYRALEGPLSAGAPVESLDQLLLAARSQVEKTLSEDLESRGIPLTSLQLRPVLADSGNPDWIGRPHLWVEFLSPEVATSDGFQVVIDMASLVTPILEERLDHLNATRSTRGALEEAVNAGCQGMGLENFVWRRAQWTDKILELTGDALEQSGLELRVLAITDVQVRPRTEAFRPTKKPVLDPLLNLHFMAYGDVVRDPQRKDVDP
jgi:hypothetical protein